MFSFPAQSRCPGPSSSPGLGLAQLAQFLALARPSQTAPQLRCLVIIVRIIVKLCRLAAPSRFPLVFPTPPARRPSRLQCCRAAVPLQSLLLASCFGRFSYFIEDQLTLNPVLVFLSLFAPLWSHCGVWYRLELH